MAELEDYDGPTPTSEWMDPGLVLSALERSKRGEAFKIVRPVTGGAAGEQKAILADDHKHIASSNPAVNLAQCEALVDSNNGVGDIIVWRGFIGFDEPQPAINWSKLMLLPLGTYYQLDAGYGSPPAISVLECYPIVAEFDITAMTWNNQTVSTLGKIEMGNLISSGAAGDNVFLQYLAMFGDIPAECKNARADIYGFKIQYADEAPPWPNAPSEWLSTDWINGYLL